MPALPPKVLKNIYEMAANCFFQITRSKALIAALLRDSTRPLVGLPDGEAADTMVDNTVL